MDAFIKSLEALCEQLLPILGAICLVALIIVLIRVVKLLESVEKTVDKTHGSIDLVEKSLEKVQAPLDTATKICGTIDDVHDAGVKFVNDTKEQIGNGITKAKEVISNLKTKVSGEDESSLNESKGEE